MYNATMLIKNARPEIQFTLHATNPKSMIVQRRHFTKLQQEDEQLTSNIQLGKVEMNTTNIHPTHTPLANF